ncbi:hypothetical protein POM88_025340 [Heracleum sosnowskyi]|uniref:Uncharacterized protein n=1 Tax=Heracleum sosnowskyi TaxID=360622 RepID=A0AAD8I4T9_9APIA|nr:hypothetical protein POM88_025340 [Heracleum sosnowskyi]
MRREDGKKRSMAYIRYETSWNHIGTQRGSMVCIWLLGKDQADLHVNSALPSYKCLRFGSLVSHVAHLVAREIGVSLSIYELRDKIDAISLNEIDESNGWLVGSFDIERDNIENDYVFSEVDGLTYTDVVNASGTGDPYYSTRRLKLQRLKPITKSKT